jgi:hypothetical protein
LAVLSALYTGRPSGVATRDLTQIGEAAAAAASAATTAAAAVTHTASSANQSASQASLGIVAWLARLAKPPAVRFSGEKPVNFVGIKSVEERRSGGEDAANGRGRRALLFVLSSTMKNDRAI